MAIYNIFDFYEKVHTEKMFNESGPEIDPNASGPKIDPNASGPKIDPNAFSTNRIDENFIPKSATSKDHIFSAIAARLFFFLLLIADIAWGIYSLIACVAKFAFCLISFFQISPLRSSFARSYLSLKRAVVCALALLIAIFSPALGIMFSCMYFLMYDKAGVEEVVPTSLREQFRDLFPMG